MIQKIEHELENATLTVEWDVEDVSFDHAFGREKAMAPYVVSWSLEVYFDNYALDITKALSKSMREYYANKAEDLTHAAYQKSLES